MDYLAHPITPPYEAALYESEPLICFFVDGRPISTVFRPTIELWMEPGSVGGLSS